METLQGRDLKTAVWINQHHSMLVKIGHIIAMAITIIIWLWFIVQVIIYVKDYSITKTAEQSLLAQSGDFSTISRPVSLTIIESGVLDAGGDSADAYALVKNSNSLFAARFSYSFSVGGKTAEFTDGFIMPNQEQYFVVRGVPIEGITGGANFAMQNLSWEKLHGLPPNTQFDIEEIAFGAADVVTPVIVDETDDRTGASEVLEDETNTNTDSNGTSSANTNDPNRLINTNSNTNSAESEGEEVEFATPEDITEPDESDTTLTKSDITALSTVVSNNSPVGFRTASAIVVVRDQNNTIIAIHKQVLKNFYSFDQQAVNMNWPRRFVFNATPELYIYADYLDRDNLILLGEE